MAEYDAETKTYSACAGGTSGASSPYSPDFDGRLLGVSVLPIDNAATSLVNGLQFKLTCTKWTPNAIEVFGNGTGLRTVPAFAQPRMDYVVDQPIKAGVPITIEGRNLTADTPVTVGALVLGYFEGS
jgi:hypothetical protein